VCHVISDDKGQFTFPSIPPGSYKVVPHYEGPHGIKFDVRPVEIDFTVEHGTYRIDTEFKVSTQVFSFIIYIFFLKIYGIKICKTVNKS
jgi:protocatechuate 3,4-dioxygenase beta subunit